MSTALHIINGIISDVHITWWRPRAEFKSWNPEPSWASPLPDISTTTHHVVVDTATKVHDYVVVPTVPRPSYRTLWCLMCWVSRCVSGWVWTLLNACADWCRALVSNNYFVSLYGMRIYGDQCICHDNSTLKKNLNPLRAKETVYMVLGCCVIMQTSKRMLYSAAAIRWPSRGRGQDGKAMAYHGVKWGADIQPKVDKLKLCFGVYAEMCSWEAFDIHI